MKIKTAGKKVILDMFLNIVAVAIPVAVLQFYSYPMLAKLGAEKYGLMITIYSVWVVVSNTIGTALDNVRLLNSNWYIQNEKQGDFVYLFKIWNVINVIIVTLIFCIYSKSHNPIEIMGAGIIAVLFAGKAYLEVGFRIKLNYLAIVISNLLQGIGFILGTIVALKTGIWQFVFLLGFLLCDVYCVCKTGLLSESSKKTEHFSVVNADCNRLIVANTIGNMMNYADKLVLYPLMGAYAVSIYYTATILGKIVSMLTGPINNVVLSYISRWDNSKKNILNKVLIVGLIIAAAGYAVTLLVARPIISLLYPQWVDEVIKYIPLTTITIMLMAIISMVQPFVLKFCEMKWQIAINIVGVGVYFVSALILWKIYGLVGFCLGTIIGAAAKLGVMLVIYYKKEKYVA